MAGRERLKRPTVNEVARLAGVSAMTVSRTLAGGQHVTPDLQRRVREAADRLGYRRNENARSIRPGQVSGLIGVAITNLANPYYGLFALGVEDVAVERGRRILLGNSAENVVRERRLVEDFIGRQVEGLVVVPSGPDSRLDASMLSSVPLVFASRLVPGLVADAVLVDDVGGARQGTQWLIDAGYRRIAYLGTENSIFTGQRRYTGYIEALRAAGMEPDPDLALRSQDAEGAREAMSHLLDVARPPTAVFCANNRNAVGALTAIGERIADGVPAADLPAVMSFDRFELAELMPVPVMVVDHDPREVGAAAARMLFDRLDGNTLEEPRTMTIPTVLKVASP